MFQTYRPVFQIGNNLSERPIASAPLWQRIIPPALPALRLHGLDVVHAKLSPTLAWFEARLKSGMRTRVAFLNAHCVNLMVKDPAYRAALARADAVLPDGSGIAFTAWLQGQRLAANLNGTDLIPMLCTRLGRQGRSVYLLGGRPGVAQAAAKALASRCSGLRIAGVRDGYFTQEDEDQVVDAVNRSGADLVLVARGVPLQDVFLDRVSDRLLAPLQFGVGGLFDFLSDQVSRAPAVLRNTGMEWCWRLAQEPGRMWQRYILGNPAYLARSTAETIPCLRRRLDLLVKRQLDILLSASALVALSPLFLLVGAAVRATSKGPAFYRQIRIGENGNTFTMFKFRSMVLDADKRRAALDAENQHGRNGVTFKSKRDPRLTRIGRLLRRSSIDELPQLLNVLRGEMSLVGPRPPLPSEVVRYSGDQVRRLQAKPGLTCLWQISGRAELAFERQVALDVEYLARRSVLLDLSILLRTVPAVLAARGAY